MKALRVKDETMIACYGSRKLYNGIPDSSKGVPCFDFLLSEKTMQCPWCTGQLIKWKDQRVTHYSRRYERDELSISRDEIGLQVEEYIAYCEICGFWMGRGTRSDMGPNMHRSVYGVVKVFDIGDKDIPTDLIIKHLHRYHNKLTSLDPFRAEKFVMDLIQSTTGLSVEKVGGVRDRGVDGFVLSKGVRKGLVQVKWRKDTYRTESVKVVREILGTMIARGVPLGYFVSTRQRLSQDALCEIEAAGESPLTRCKMRLTYLGQTELLSMIDVAAQLASIVSGLPEAAVEIIEEMQKIDNLENTFFDRGPDTPFPLIYND